MLWTAGLFLAVERIEGEISEIGAEHWYDDAFVVVRSDGIGRRGGVNPAPWGGQ